MSFMRVWSSFLSLLIFIGLNASATGNDKAQYTIFKPTPKDKMRELSTDRPDKTESPYTVDAGHYQIESDLYITSQDLAKDDPSPGLEDKRTYTQTLNTNFKVGLTNSVDLQVVFALNEKRDESVTGQAAVSKSGFSDTVVRLKWNLIGNDGGDFSIALMPTFKIPTNTGGWDNKVVESALIIPIGLNLPNDWGLGYMMVFSHDRNENDSGFHTEFVSSVTMSHDIIGDLGGYIEFYSESSNEDSVEWIATGDMGLTYGLTPDIQFDIGANIGLTDAADDFETFIGASARF